VHGLAQGFAELGLSAHEVAFGKQGKTKVIMMGSATAIGVGYGSFQIFNIFVDVVVLFFHVVLLCPLSGGIL